VVYQNLSAAIFNKNITAPYYKKGLKTLKALLSQEADPACRVELRYILFTTYSATAFPTSIVLAVPPRSGVMIFF
jgi:hypothetical protein